MTTDDLWSKWSYTAIKRVNSATIWIYLWAHVFSAESTSGLSKARLTQRNVNASNATHASSASQENCLRKIWWNARKGRIARNALSTQATRGAVQIRVQTLSRVLSPCLNTNPHSGPHPSLGQGRGQGQSEGQPTRLKLVLYRGRDSLQRKDALSMPEWSILKFSEVSLHMYKKMIRFINTTIIKLKSMYALLRVLIYTWSRTNTNTQTQTK